MKKLVLYWKFWKLVTYNTIYTRSFLYDCTSDSSVNLDSRYADCNPCLVVWHSIHNLFPYTGVTCIRVHGPKSRYTCKRTLAYKRMGIAVDHFTGLSKETLFGQQHLHRAQLKYFFCNWDWNLLFFHYSGVLESKRLASSVPDVVWASCALV